MQSGVKSVDEAHNLIDESKDILARTLDAKVFDCLLTQKYLSAYMVY